MNVLYFTDQCSFKPEPRYKNTAKWRKRCLRRVPRGEKYCWQHKPKQEQRA